MDQILSVLIALKFLQKIKILTNQNLKLFFFFFKLTKFFKFGLNYLFKIKSDYSLSNNEKSVRKIYQFSVSQRPFFCWLVFGTITAGTALYIWQIFAPDYRSEIDPVHYYSDWKVF